MSDTVTEVPGGCTCTWECEVGSRQWRRIGTPKEDCPEHGGGQAPPRPPRRDPHDYPPEWLDDDRGA